MGMKARYQSGCSTRYWWCMEIKGINKLLSFMVSYPRSKCYNDPYLTKCVERKFTVSDGYWYKRRNEYRILMECTCTIERICIPPGGVSTYTFGYRRTTEIFKTPPFIYSIFFENYTHSYIFVENPDPIIYFITMSLMW
jgi:hypothetical protein